MVAPMKVVDNKYPALTFKSANEMLTKFRELIHGPRGWDFYTSKHSSKEIFDFLSAAIASPFADKLIEEINPEGWEFDSIPFKVMCFNRQPEEYFKPGCEYEQRGWDAAMNDEGKYFLPYILPFKHPEIGPALKQLNDKYLANIRANKEYSAECLEKTVPNNVKRMLAEASLPLAWYTDIPHINWLAKYMEREVPFDKKKFREVCRNIPENVYYALRLNMERPRVEEKIPKNYTMRGARKRLDKVQAVGSADAAPLFELMRPLCRGDWGQDGIKAVHALIEKYAAMLLQERYKDNPYRRIGGANQQMKKLICFVSQKYNVVLPQIDLDALNTPQRDAYVPFYEHTKICNSARPVQGERMVLHHQRHTEPTEDDVMPELQQNEKISKKYSVFIGDKPKKFMYTIDVYAKEPCVIACKPIRCPQNADHSPDYYTSNSMASLKAFEACSNFMRQIPIDGTPANPVTLRAYMCAPALRPADEILQEFQTQIENLRATRKTKGKTL